MSALSRLAETVEARKGADPESSWTAKLFAKGPEKCAEKFGEEAVERGGDAVLPDVLEYLVSLAAARPADVRDYMEMHPPPSS